MKPLLYPLPSESVPRRQFLTTAASITTALLWSGCASGPLRRRVAFTNYPFSLGIASGDPLPDGFVIWTRLAPEPLQGGGMPHDAIEVSWIVAEDEHFSKGVKAGHQIARPEWAHSVHVEVEGLKPDRWYWYQFRCGTETSPIGRARTTPLPGAIPANFKFAFASCQHFEAGYFTAFEHMVREDLAMIVHLGDYIYEGAGREKQVRKHIGKEIHTLDDYRNRHAQYKTDTALQAAHAAAPWLVTWDDHEVDNNYAGEISEELDVPPRQLLVRRAAAYQAFYEHMPLRRSSIPVGPDMQIYREVAIGRLAKFYLLDTRQYRSDQPSGGRRSAPSTEALSRKATMLGAPQREWLFAGLGTSNTRWNILAQQVMMASVDRQFGEGELFSMDQWPGYEMERRKILEFLAARRISNPVVLTGDIHSNWANELTLHCDSDFTFPVAAEFVGTSISSGGDGRRVPAKRSETLSENPFVKFHNAERGYVTCDLSPAEWRTQFRTMDFVTKPGGKIATRASFTLESGTSHLHRS